MEKFYLTLVGLDAGLLIQSADKFNSIINNASKMRHSLFVIMLCFLLTILYVLKGSVAEIGPLVNTSLGQIRGFYTTSFDGRTFSAFEGIPYAKPPIGDLRFEPPQNVPPWNGVLDANKQYACKQIENQFLNLGISTEDCLYLNVYVPKTQISTDDNYDVIVNIHGGAFMMGASRSFAGPRLLMDRDIIYVNMNYRLGILGFLSTEDNVLPGNNGLKDQQHALKWVQTHIKQFGGNPKSVTLMGASAGGACVHFHYFAPQSKGLFQRGISQSGNVLMPWAIQEGALQKAKILAASLNCEESNTRSLIKCLKGIPADDLVNKTQSFYHLADLPLAPFAPVIEVESESAFLTKHPYFQLRDGDMNDVPWLTWIVTDEGNIVAMMLQGFVDELHKNWKAFAEHLFDYKYACSDDQKDKVAQQIKSFYFENEQFSKTNISSLTKIFGDRLFNVGFETAVQMQAAVTNSSVYAAIYGYKASITFLKAIGVDVEGVGHGDEGLLIHDYQVNKSILPEDVHLSKSDVQMKEVLLDLLTSFAINDKPQSKGVKWQPLTASNPKYLLINDLDNISMSEIPELSPRGFWEGLILSENEQFYKNNNKK